MSGLLDPVTACTYVCITGFHSVLYMYKCVLSFGLVECMYVMIELERWSLV